MAASLLAYEVADLCLGKPPLKSLSVSGTVADALAAVKKSENNCISIWSCDHYSSKTKKIIGVNQIEECVCIGKICMVDIICYLCREENISSPSLALNSPVSALLSEVSGLVVRHVEPSSSIVEAIDLILQGAQNLVVPIKSSITTSSKRKLLQKSTIAPTIHNGREFCWLTQEDVVRFLLNSIGMFSPVASLSVEKLGIIDTDVLAIRYHSAASDAVDAFIEALENQTSVAVVDSDDGSLIGEISPFTLSYCDESVAAAITTLSAGDLMAYIDCGGPPEEITRVVKSRLKERDLNAMLEELMIDSSNNAFTTSSSSSSSSDDESVSPTSTLSSRSRRHSRSSSYSARMVRRAEAIVCHRRSTLVAVMIQALAHRVNYVWVIEEDGTVVGMVTFVRILEVFHSTFSPN